MREHGPTRRALLGGSLLLTAACAPLGRTAFPEGDEDRDLAIVRRAIDNEEALIARYEEATRQHPQLADRLAPIAAHHREHVAALRRRLPPGETAPGASPAGRSPGTPPVWAPAPLSGSPELALAALEGDEQAAAAARVNQVRDASAPLAQLLASLGASEASHTVLLAEGR